jgi:hypothetical protein
VNCEKQITSTIRLKNTYRELRNNNTIGGWLKNEHLEIEPFSIITAVQQHREHWRPKNPR